MFSVILKTPLKVRLCSSHGKKDAESRRENFLEKGAPLYFTVPQCFADNCITLKFLTWQKYFSFILFQSLAYLMFFSLLKNTSAGSGLETKSKQIGGCTKAKRPHFIQGSQCQVGFFFV